jgi:hypothetical protein
MVFNMIFKSPITLEIFNDIFLARGDHFMNFVYSEAKKIELFNTINGTLMDQLSMIYVGLEPGRSKIINLVKYWDCYIHSADAVSLSTSQYTVPSAVSRPFRMTCCALADGNAMVDAIRYQVACKSNGRTHFIHHVLCHPGFHWAWSVTLIGRHLAEGTVCYRICPKTCIPCSALIIWNNHSLHDRNSKSLHPIGRFTRVYRRKSLFAVNTS